MEVAQEAGHWLIRDFLGQIDAGGIRGTLSRSANRVRDRYAYWFGDCWRESRSGCTIFQTEEDGKEYLKANCQAMDACRLCA